MKSLICFVILTLSHTLYANDVSENTHLVNAIRLSNIEEVKSALASGADVNFKIQQSQDRWTTPLYEAIKSGNTETVDILIEHDANLYKIDSQGNTALHIATFYARIKLMELFLEKGISVHARDNRGNTPLHIVHLINDQGDSEVRLKVARFLLKAGADVNAVNDLFHFKSENFEQILRTVTPLHLAAAKGNLKFLNFLIDEAHANIHARDSHGMTPLYYVAFIGKSFDAISPARALIKAGASRFTARAYLERQDANNLSFFEDVSPQRMASILGRPSLALFIRYYEVYEVLRFCFSPLSR